MIRLSTLIGYASRSASTKMCPAPIAVAFRAASAFRSSSLPSTLVRHAPEASLNAMPNLACGTVFTTAS